ncbi:TolC family protein [Methyloversatilis thermotolerans]|uniref:TolC family protein n=1 Tax=Methyloversatilis thermotolerans TaxID=1346290 RepID=UPI0012F853C8|nr:TolC family protein [Methyloversatilis thermotolerans]
MTSRPFFTLASINTGRWPARCRRVLSAVAWAFTVALGHPLPEAHAQTAFVSAPDASALTLRAAEQRLFDASRDLRRARRDVERAQAATLGAAARPNATLSLDTTDINPSRGIGAGSLADKRVDTVLRLEQTFERGDKRSLRMAQADLLLDAARADQDEARRQMLKTLRIAYFDLKLAEDRRALLQQTLALLDDTVSRARTRVTAGDLAPSDLERVRLDQLRTESDLRVADSDLRRAQAALARLLALDGQDALLHAADPWPQPDALPAAADAAAGERPDLRAARARLLAAQQGRSLAESLRTRDITIGVQYEHFPPDGRAMYGVGVSIPLFNGYDYRGEIEAAYTELGAAEDEQQRVEAEAGAELRLRRNEAEAQAARVRRYADTVLPSARRSAEATEFAFQHGAVGVLDVLDARRTLRSIESEALSARADYARARAELAAALNQPF